MEFAKGQTERIPTGQFVATNFIRKKRATHVVNTPDSVTFPFSERGKPKPHGRRQKDLNLGRQSSSGESILPPPPPPPRVLAPHFLPPDHKSYETGRPTEPAQRGRDQPPLAIKSHSIFSHDGMGYLHSKTSPLPLLHTVSPRNNR